jgi:Protein of unknown function (DUF1559)
MNYFSGCEISAVLRHAVFFLTLAVTVAFQSDWALALPWQDRDEPPRCVVGFVGKPSAIMSSSFFKDSGMLPADRENPEFLLMSESESIRGVLAMPVDFEEFADQGPESTDFYLEFTLKSDAQDSRYFKRLEKIRGQAEVDGDLLIYQNDGVKSYRTIFDGRHIIVASDAFEYTPKKLPPMTDRLEKLLDEKSKSEGFLAFDAKSARSFLELAGDFGNKNLPPMAKPYLEMLTRLEGVVVTLEMDETAFFKARLECEQSQDAKDAVRMVDELVEMAKQNSQGSEPGAVVARKILDSVKASSSGSDVEISVEIDEAATRVSKLAAEEANLMNNQRQAAISTHNFYDAYNRFPFLAGEGQSNELSWRVRVLLFLDQRELSEKFDLSQPWDSPQNRKVLEEMPMPAVFGNSGTKTNLAWVESDVQTFQDITRGTSNTIAFVHSDKFVHWTENNNVTPEQVIAQFKALKEGEYLIASFYDGSVRKIRHDTDLEEFSAMLKPTDDD